MPDVHSLLRAPSQKMREPGDSRLVMLPWQPGCPKQRVERDGRFFVTPLLPGRFVFDLGFGLGPSGIRRLRLRLDCAGCSLFDFLKLAQLFELAIQPLPEKPRLRLVTDLL